MSIIIAGISAVVLIAIWIDAIRTAKNPEQF